MKRDSWPDITNTGQTEDTNDAAYLVMQNGTTTMSTIIPQVPLASVNNALGQYSLVHATECTAAGNTNNDRTTIGIGEVVDLSGMPGNTVWSLSGGGSISGTNGSGIGYTAPLSPTNATIYAQVGTAQPLPVTFSVIAPAGFSVSVKTNLGLGTLGTNEIGASTMYWVQILPTNVSFVHVEMRENISPAVTNTWPNGSKFYVLATNAWGFDGDCLPAFTDTIAEILHPINKLYDGTNYQNFSYSLNYHNEYQNQDGDWVPFVSVQTTTEYNSDGTCQETYQGVPGSWQGPWQ